MPSPTPSTPDAWRDLVLYLGSRFVGTIGVQVQSVAIGWQVYARTGEAIDLAWVGLSQFVPLALLSLWAGNVVDRSHRKRVLVSCRALYGVGALALAALARMPELGVLPIYGVLVVLGATRAFAAPASWALLPGLVPAERLQRAIGLSSSTFQIATIAGPAVGGAVYALGGASAAYLTTAICEACAVAFLISIRRSFPKYEAPKERGLDLLLSGVRYVWREKILFGAISLDLFAVLLGGAVALMPIYASDILHVGETGLGLLRSANAVGAAVVGLILAFRPVSRHAGRWMFVCVALFGLATIAFGLSQNFVLSLVALAILGATDMVSVQIRQTLIQVQTPDDMRGRVSSVSMIFIGASNELGEFESGVTADLLGGKGIGAVRAVVLGGIGTLMATGLWAVLFPQLRKADRLETPQR